MRSKKHRDDEDVPDIVSIQSVGENDLNITIRILAANNFVAKQRARLFIRRNYPSARNILSPNISGSEPVQTTFNDLFPETFNREQYEVSLVVKR